MYLFFRYKLKSIIKSEDGQALPLFALLLVLLLGFLTFSIDIGRLYYQKNDLQNIADTAALAAAYEMMAIGYSDHVLATLDSPPASLVLKNQNNVDVITCSNVVIVDQSDVSSGTYYDGSYYTESSVDSYYDQIEVATTVVEDYLDVNGLDGANVKLKTKCVGDIGSVTLSVELDTPATLGQLISDVDSKVQVTSIVKVDRAITLNNEGVVINVDIEPKLVKVDPID